MKHPFCDLKLVPKEISDRWNSAISKVIASGIFISGPQKKEFELRFAQMIKTKFALGVSNGLDGLVLALKSLGANTNSIVAVPEHTFIATLNAVDIVGCRLVSVRVGPDGLMDLKDLENIQENIDFVIPVHMHGGVVDMERLIKWALPRNIRVIEDASQAHFSKSGDRYAGTFGDVGVFSLYPTKNLGALGDAGVVVTNDKKTYEVMRSFSNYGASKDSKYIHEFLGINARLDEIQAAVLNVNLDYILDWNAHRKTLAQIYISKFMSAEIDFLHQRDSVYHHFVIFPKDRVSMIEKLQRVGIGTDIHYPIPAIDEYSNLSGKNYRDASLHAKKISKYGLSLPLHQWMTPDDTFFIANKVVEFDS